MNASATPRARSRPSRHRVAVTGIGVLSPAGNSPKQALATLVTGESTATDRPDLSAGDRVHFACGVDALDDVPSLTAKEHRRLDRFSRLALAAALDAVRDSALDTGAAAERTGVFVGTGVGGLAWMERAVLDYSHRLDRIPPHAVLRVMNSSPAAHISARLGARGMSMTFTTACASGASAIGEGAERIRHGALDVVVAGGVDAPLTPLVLSSFAAMRALSRRHDEPGAASRPFDDERDGFVMAEGATFLVLERLDLAVARGATVHGEVLGYAGNTDVGHLVAPSEDAVPALASIRLALEDAALGPGDVGHVSAHGTSTVLNDRVEAAALERAFGSLCPPVTAVKGVVGHMIGAAGAFEAAMGLLCARDGIVPPVANFRSGRDADRIDLVHGAPRRIGTGPVLSTSFGFGGQNTCLVLGPAS